MTPAELNTFNEAMTRKNLEIMVQREAMRKAHGWLTGLLMTGEYISPTVKASVDEAVKRLKDEL